MALVAPPVVVDRKRVKVYELKRNDWHDRGTGFCVGTFLNDEPRLHVESEDEPQRVLLDTRITKDDGYQKQQDTLIVWTEQNVTDMALSFQEAEGCAAIWDFVSEAQQRMSTAEDGFPAEAAEPLLPLAPDLPNLADIDNIMRMCNNSAQTRDQLTQFVIAKEYVYKLVPLVEKAEEYQQLNDLHRLCNIMKTIILLNDSNILDRAVSDDCFMGLVGALEYDPDFPMHKANHRQYLTEVARFREVVTIEDPDVRARFHKCYRLQYLKDVVLARMIDDPTFGTLNGAIYFHQYEIIMHIQSNPAILKELFGIFIEPSPDMQKRKDAVCFIQQSCAAVKNMQPVSSRQLLHSQFLNHGLIHVVTFALRHPENLTRVFGAEILMSIAEQDINLVRQQVMRPGTEGQMMIEVLIDVLLAESELGVQTQVGEVVKNLLEPASMFGGPDPNPQQRPNIEFMTKIRTPLAPQPDEATKRLYEQCWRRLFAPLQELPLDATNGSLEMHQVALCGSLLDMLSHFVKQYASKGRTFELSQTLTPRISKLLSRPEKHLKLAVLKYFRVIVSLHDQSHDRLFVEGRLFEPILDVLFETMPRDNLLNSICLELFEFVKRETLKELTIHLVETYRPRLESVTYVDTFRQLIDKYEKMTAHAPDTLSFTSVDTEPIQHRPTITNGAGRWQNALREQDAEEDAYFNGPDEEDDEERLNALKPFSNGFPNKPLVDYPEDEDDVDILAQSEDEPSQVSTRAASTSTTDSAASPPERIGDKRRREEVEEEDELSQLSSQPKRRGSVSSTDSRSEGKENNTNSTRALRRKSSINSGKDGGGGGNGPRKISINLGSKHEKKKDDENHKEQVKAA